MGSANAAVRAAWAKRMRDQVPREAHGDWEPAADRPDPVQIIAAQEAGRLQSLLPVRHARMAQSAFAFFRGTAAVMAADLAATEHTGVRVQACGDAHLANFGMYASAERRQVFDVNDFDETIPAPWEWDVKRLAASFVVAARDNGFDDAIGRRCAQRAAATYRDATRAFAKQSPLETWYAKVPIDDMRSLATSKARRRKVDSAAAKASRKTSERALARLTELVDGELRIQYQPPLLVPLNRENEHMPADEVDNAISSNLGGYRASLADDRRRLLDRFEVQDIALKVVGVGSVGTRCLIVLFTAKDNGAPLVLQMKEATASVLQPYVPASPYASHGERVVWGQKLTQATSDVFLGWSIGIKGHHFYWRQFHDMKGSIDIAAMDPADLDDYAVLCGWTLAHGHARSGDPVAIGAYLGSGDTFDLAMGRFAVAYADQNERDYAAFTSAIAHELLPAADSGA